MARYEPRGSNNPQQQGLWWQCLLAVLSVRYVQQSVVLTWKNLLVAWRNRQATLLRLFAPFVFLLLALVIQVSLDANSRREARIRAADTTQPEPISPIPSCHDDIFIGNKPCVTFIFSPNTSNLVQDIITNIRKRNAPAIAANQVVGFATRNDAEDYMVANPESTLGAVHFMVDDTSTPPDIKYSIQTNTTTKRFKGITQSPVTFFTLPVTAAVAREISRVQLAASGGDPEALVWNPKLVQFPHPQLRSIGMVGYVLGPFIFASCMFGMVMQLASVVGEKETGLRVSLCHMGLLQSSYWTSWVVADLLLGLATSLSIVIWGLIMQFRFFLRNDVGLLVLLFWLLSLALSSFSYFLSVFLQRAQSATYTGFAVFLVGWVCQTVVIFGVPYDPATYFAPSGVGKAFFWVFAFMPWCPLAKACLDLAAATNTDKDPGLRWSQRDSYCQYIPDAALQPPYDPTKMFIDYDCTFPLSQCYITLVIQAIGWLAAAIYFDNVWPAGNAKPRPPWYFLMPSYWVRSKPGKGVSAHRQQKLLLDTAAGATALHGGTKEPAQLHRGQWAAPPQQHALQQQQMQRGTADTRLQIPAAAAAAGGGSRAAVDDDVSAEEARMQGVLAALSTSTKTSASRRVSHQLSSVPSWPQITTQPSTRQHTSHSGGRELTQGVHTAVRSPLSTPSLRTSAAADAEPDAQCQVVEGDADTATGSEGGWDVMGYAVAVFGLAKVFKASRCLSGCCGSTAGDYHALRGVWLGIKPGQLFALLGPNGAGKTTMINCLTGLLSPSGGDMLVCGESILSEGALDSVRCHIGVCPQFDMLWGELTGVEHLIVAGHVKGLPWGEVRQAASQLLQRVQLTSASGVRSSAYSGGMKRRLSVALALVGDPKVLYLDEPTTGMDPISRRAVWDVIQTSKAGRAIVLTTHSMEEADILGDRIGIMARGCMRALGSSIRLKQKFGAGYQVVVTLDTAKKNGPRQRKVSRQQQLSAAESSGTGSSLSPGNGAAARAVAAGSPVATAAIKTSVKALFAAELSGLKPHEEGKRVLRYLVPRKQQDQLVGLLRKLEAAMAEGPDSSSSSVSAFGAGGGWQGLSDGEKEAAEGAAANALRQGVADVQLSLTSLEEVFLAIAKQAELEASAESGSTVTITLPDTGRQLKVAVGQDWVMDTPVHGAAVAGHGNSSGGAAASGSSSNGSSGTGGREAGGRAYFIKWVQDETGALAVLEVVPARGVQGQQQVFHDAAMSTATASGSRLAAVAPVAD